VFSTLAGLLIAVAFVLPGFIAADLAETRRARPRRTDPELILRALTYALLIQALVALTGWTGQLISDTDSGRLWDEHISAVVLFVVVVIILVPTLVGLGLNALLRRAEQRGNLSPLHYALGGRDARQGWDYIFERFGSGYVFLTLRPGVKARPSFLVAKFARSSWAPQQPSEVRDVYFEQIWLADQTGRITGEFAEQRGLWISLDQVDMMQFISPPEASSAPTRRLWRWLGGS
jgi:Family of unknown function (DUF6338)